MAVALATPTVLAAVVRAALTFREVRSLAESRRQAHTDELTGLGNRRLVYTQLEAARRTRRYSSARFGSPVSASCSAW